MQQVVISVKKQGEGIIRATVALVALSLVLAGGLIAYDSLYQRFSPASSWFVYDAENPVVPEADSVQRGQFMAFHSNSQYYRQIEMTWSDTMMCEVKSGRIERVDTQVWMDTMTPRKTPDNVWWTWFKKPFPVDAVRCYMQSVAVGKTPRGYKKTQRFRSKWFRIGG